MTKKEMDDTWLQKNYIYIAEVKVRNQHQSHVGIDIGRGRLLKDGKV